MARLVSYMLAAWLVLSLDPSSSWGRNDLSGVWKEAYTETIVQVDQWSPECGTAPRSKGKKKRGLLFTIEDRGVELEFKSASGKTFSTTQCLTKNTQVKPKERSVKDKLFLVACATEETAQAYESGRYTFRVKSANRIDYRETTRFSRNIQGAVCVHTRRIRKSFVRQKGVKPPNVAGSKIGDAKDDACNTSGPIASLKLEPSRAELLVGEKICLKAVARDANDCPVKGDLSWGKGSTPPGVKLTTRGCLKVTDQARKGTQGFRLSFAGKEADFTLVVIRPGTSAPEVRPAKKTARVRDSKKEPKPKEAKPPDAGVTKPKAAEPAAVSEPAVDAGIDAGTPEPEPAQVESPDAGTRPASAQADPQAPDGDEQPAWILPVAIAGIAFVLLLLVILILVRRKRSRQGVSDSPDQAAQPEPPPTAEESAAPGPAVTSTDAPDEATPEAAITSADAPVEATPQPAVTSSDAPDEAFCTTCGKAIPAEARFCPYDRTPIYRPGSPTLQSAPVCPTCKRLLPAGAKFCPYDRTKLS